MVVSVTRRQTKLPGRALLLVTRTHNLFTETGQEVSLKGTVARLHGGKMTIIVPLTVRPTTHLMKRDGNLTHIASNHILTVTHATAMMTGTGITTTQAETALIGPSQDP
jgi:hypothetical protein